MNPRILLALCISIGLPGCYPVYTFRTIANAESTSPVTSLQERLRIYLENHGFHDSGRSGSAIGDIGCGQDAADRTTFTKGYTFIDGNHWVWVHEFSCQSVWYVVIVTSRGTYREGADLRKALASEFAPEIKAGVVEVSTTCRIALE